MTGEEIRKIRADLDITQDDLAAILGVTKASIGRYETDQAKPSDNTQRRLLYLQESLVNPEQKEHLRAICHRDCGNGVLAAMLAFAATTLPLVPLPLVGLTLFGLFKAPAGKILLESIREFQGEKK